MEEPDPKENSKAPLFQDYVEKLWHTSKSSSRPPGDHHVAGEFLTW